MKHLLPVVDGRVYIFDIDLLKILREEYHIAGVLAGTLPQFPQQNIFGGLPLQLMPEDVKFLLETGKFEIYDSSKLVELEVTKQTENENDNKTNTQLITTNHLSASDINATPTHSFDTKLIEPAKPRYDIYKYLMQRGYFIMPGLRFGSHFMAYPGDLMRYHSHYNVLGFGWDEQFNMLDIVNGGRLATSVKKCWLIGAENPETEETEVFSVEWAGFG